MVSNKIKFWSGEFATFSRYKTERNVIECEAEVWRTLLLEVWRLWQIYVVIYGQWFYKV